MDQSKLDQPKKVIGFRRPPRNDAGGKTIPITNPAKEKVASVVKKVDLAVFDGQILALVQKGTDTDKVLEIIVQQFMRQNVMDTIEHVFVIDKDNNTEEKKAIQEQIDSYLERAEKVDLDEIFTGMVHKADAGKPQYLELFIEAHNATDKEGNEYNKVVEFFENLGEAYLDTFQQEEPIVDTEESAAAVDDFVNEIELYDITVKDFISQWNASYAAHKDGKMTTEDYNKLRTSTLSFDKETAKLLGIDDEEV